MKTASNVDAWFNKYPLTFEDIVDSITYQNKLIMALITSANSDRVRKNKGLLFYMNGAIAVEQQTRSAIQQH